MPIVASKREQDVQHVGERVVGTNNGWLELAVPSERTQARDEMLRGTPLALPACPAILNRGKGFDLRKCFHRPSLS
jgi:hypothetical protein